jgi:hypothetical protein
MHALEDLLRQASRALCSFLFLLGESDICSLCRRFGRDERMNKVVVSLVSCRMLVARSMQCSPNVVHSRVT